MLVVSGVAAVVGTTRVCAGVVALEVGGGCVAAVALREGLGFGFGTAVISRALAVGLGVVCTVVVVAGGCL